MVAACAAANEHTCKHTAGKLAAAMAAQLAAISVGCDAASAALAGEAAAAAVLPLPDDPLDKVARHEEGASGWLSCPCSAGSQEEDRKEEESYACCSCGSIESDSDVPDREPRAPPPSVKLLKALLKSKGLPLTEKRRSCNG